MNYNRVSEICKKIGITVGKYEEDGAYSGELLKGKEPEMPDQLDDLSSETLANHLNIHSEWANYLCSRLSEYEVAVQSIEEDLEYTYAAELSREESADKVTIKKARIRAREDVQEKLALKGEAEGICKLLRTAVRVAENRVASLSRNISARSTSMANINRRDNVQKVPNVPSFGQRPARRVS